jgi:hypothetical protein
MSHDVKYIGMEVVGYFEFSRTRHLVKAKK